MNFNRRRRDQDRNLGGEEKGGALRFADLVCVWGNGLVTAELQMP